MRHSLIAAIGFSVMVPAWTMAVAQVNPANRVENPVVKAEYPLNPKCGPWMVMVKSFRGPDAVTVANKLARELREKHKIPAYTFVKNLDQPTVQPVGMVRGHTRQYLSAAVLAGDCKNEKVAAKLQDEIQKLRPSTISEDMVPKYQWEAGPLRTAFCLPNPLGPKEPPKPDPVLVKVNSGKNSIFNCPGQYSLEVALFTGGIAYTRSQAKKLEENSLLEAAGEHAEQVATQLCRAGYEAYVYHGLTYSLVCVGNFSNPQDPQVEQLAQKLANQKIGAFYLSPSPRLMMVPQRP